MTSVVCTLFEGHYHHGVAALSNSLYRHGYRGVVYVGYRGELPNWILNGKKISFGKWEGITTFVFNEEIQLIFLLLKTTYSLTNYKPDFMLELIEEFGHEMDAIFYFDPDIVIDDSWTCYEQWVNCGVALCEDINSPLQEFHPRRVGWRNYFKKYDVNLKFKNSIYVNGGFIGLKIEDVSFLILWKKIQEIMSEAIGGLENSIFSNGDLNSTILRIEGFQIFDKSDQDALNATIESYEGTISLIGKEGMAFVPGKPIMYHALGSPKPWKANYFLRAFKGRSPRNVDLAYWEYTNQIILAHPKLEIAHKLLSIKVAKLIGRFYRVK